jgi:hypothetical protein
MDLRTALEKVIADTREQDGNPDLPAAAAVADARTCTDEDISDGCDDPALREAYQLVVLNTSQADIDAALATLTS